MPVEAVSAEAGVLVELRRSTDTPVLQKDLSSPDLNVTGLTRDGWVSDATSFDLARPPAPSVVIIGLLVPNVGDPTFETEISLLVDDVEIGRKTCGVGQYRLRATLPSQGDQWRVELRFSAFQQLPEPDGRRIAAKVHILGFETPELMAPSEGTGSEPSTAALSAEASPDTPRQSERTAAPPLPPPPERIFTSETVIRPSASPLSVQLREMWRYRHLFVALVWRNIRIEFDAMRLGSIWAVSRPILFAIVFGFFRNLSGANTYVEIPYVAYVYSGLLLWTYFTDSATNAASAVRNDVSLLTKIYYPRLLTPLVPTTSNLVILIIGMVPLSIIMAWSNVRPGWDIIFLPVVILPCIILALGLGLLVSALSIEDRDWERVLAFGLTIGLWLGPVIYAPEMIPEQLRQVFHLNPMAGALLGFRSVIFEGVDFPVYEWLYSLLSSCAVLWLGIRVFRRTELQLVDRL